MKILACVAAALVMVVLGLLWHSDTLSTRASAAEGKVTELSNAIESRKKTQALLADLDTQHTKELADAQKNNADLRRDVRDGKRRLSIAASCPVVRAAPSAAGVANAETRADIDPAAGERIIAIVNDGDDAIRQLSALQDWVQAGCMKPQ